MCAGIDIAHVRHKGINFIDHVGERPVDTWEISIDYVVVTDSSGYAVIVKHGAGII